MRQRQKLGVFGYTEEHWCPEKHAKRVEKLHGNFEVILLEERKLTLNVDVALDKDTT